MSSLVSAKPNRARRSRGESKREHSVEIDDGLIAVVSPWERLIRNGLPAGVGFVLWSLVCLEPLGIELGSTGARAPVVLLHIQPLLVLLLGLGLRSSVFAMAAFPCSIAVAFFALSPLDLAPLATMRGALTTAGALALFLVAAARFGPRSLPASRLKGTLLAAGVDARSRRLGRGWWLRMALILALWVVPLLALYRPGASEELVMHYGRGARDARALIHTAHLFVAVLASYVFIVLPAINHRAELHELRAELTAMRTPQRRRQGWRRIVVLLVIGGAMAAAAILLPSLV